MLADGDAGEFFSRLRTSGASLEPGTFVEAVQLVTPRFSRQRFSSTFFLFKTDKEPEILTQSLINI